MTGANKKHFGVPKMPRATPLNTKPRPSFLPAPQSKVSSVIPVSAAPTLGHSIKDGFGLGFGSAIAHRMVSGIFGAPTVTAVLPHDPTPFEQCVAENRDDIGVCAHLAEKKGSK